MRDRPYNLEIPRGTSAIAARRDHRLHSALDFEESVIDGMNVRESFGTTRTVVRRGGVGGAVALEIFSMFSQRAVPCGSGGDGGGFPSVRSKALAKRLAVLAIALTGISLSGCSQFGFTRGGCGTCGSRLFQGHLKRLFNHNRNVIVTEGCEPGLGAPCDVMPGGIAPGPVISAPAIEDVPALEPAVPSDVPATGSSSPNKRTLFETLKSNTGGTTTSRRSGSIRSFATPESASRPAPAVADAAPSFDDPLVNLPPVVATVDRTTDDAEITTPPLPLPAEEVQVANPVKPEVTPVETVVASASSAPA